MKLINSDLAADLQSKLDDCSRLSSLYVTTVLSNLDDIHNTVNLNICKKLLRELSICITSITPGNTIEKTINYLMLPIESVVYTGKVNEVVNETRQVLIELEIKSEDVLLYELFRKR